MNPAMMVDLWIYGLLQMSWLGLAIVVYTDQPLWVALAPAYGWSCLPALFALELLITDTVSKP
jgi:hypothetical protein